MAAITLLTQHVATMTQTPPHYFFLRGEFPSGESIQSAEAGLVAKVEDKQVVFGEAWERVMRLAFAVQGDPRAGAEDCEMIWRDPRLRPRAWWSTRRPRSSPWACPCASSWRTWATRPSCRPGSWPSGRPRWKCPFG